ncbi:MAG: hypothetical protein IJK06_11030 [Clostridia bacterium]|nr:hypothetical protein [Clostridia bacterium]
MYENRPVLIPDISGKISFKKKNGSEYVQYLTGRRYDPVRKYTVPEKKIIGIRIASLPEMMLPNENYHELNLSEGETTMDEEQGKAAKIYEKDRKQFVMLRDLFDQMYYEFQLQSRRKPDDPVNPYKAMRINSILEPLRRMMAKEDYADYLDLVDTTQEDQAENISAGRTYSDVALLLTQYKGAMKRFFSEKI